MTSPPVAVVGRDRLSCYILPGQRVDPTRAVPDAQQAEAVGFGTAWLSEKWGQKDCAVLLGAMAARTSAIRLGVGVTHPQTRHPIVLAGFGATMQAITGARFILGLGRGAGRPWADIGLPVPTLSMLSDLAAILRRLWAGETVAYRGPAGEFPDMSLENRYLGPPPPLALAATGPRTLAMAGAVYDYVLTQPFLSGVGMRRTIAYARSGAEEAGRDPHAIRVVHTLVVAPGLSGDESLAVIGGRLVRYLQAPGSSAALLPALNDWDPAVIDAIRNHSLLADRRARGLPPELDDRVLAQVASDVVPAEWIADGAAIGSADECADVVRASLASGADEVLVHGVTPAQAAALFASLDLATVNGGGDVGT